MLIFYFGIVLASISFTFSFVRKTIIKRLIICEVIIILSMYFGDVLLSLLPDRTTVGIETRDIVRIILTIPNFICFFVVYKISKDIKISYLPNIVGALTVILYISATQLNFIIHKGFNSGLGIENFPVALIVIFLVTLMPAILSNLLIISLKRNMIKRIV